MENWKEKFINYCFDKGIIKTATGEERFKLKSGRLSWFFFNAGAFDEGEGLKKMGEAYANAMLEAGVEGDVLYGPAYKGIPIAAAASIALAGRGVDVGYVFDRKEEKGHGEGTKAEKAKKLFVGRRPKDGMRVVLLDDVITTGGTKEEAIKKMDSVADVEYAALVVLCDREEKDEEGRLATERMRETYGMEVVSVISATDVVNYLEGAGEMSGELRAEVKDYNEKYGAYNLR